MAQHSHSHSPAAVTHRSRLYGVLTLSGVTFVAEVGGGLLTGSLALLADAGHMLTDISGIIMSLIAIRFAARPATDAKSFGYHRAEILAALGNAMLLFFVAVFVLVEALRRFQHPLEIQGGWMMLVAGIGLVVNIISMLLLRESSQESLNVRGAYLEVLGDTLGSLGVIAAGIIILATGWELADPIIGVGIGLFILPRAWLLLRESVDVLLEGTPKNLNIEALRLAIESLPGVLNVHDVHAWTITSGMHAVSAHITMHDPGQSVAILTQAKEVLSAKFGLTHSTLQVEPPGFEEEREHLHR
jgi:cobalt-zinc-cadmium efflux system protein